MVKIVTANIAIKATIKRKTPENRDREAQRVTGLDDKRGIKLIAHKQIINYSKL